MEAGGWKYYQVIRNFQSYDSNDYQTVGRNMKLKTLTCMVNLQSAKYDQYNISY